MVLSVMWTGKVAAFVLLVLFAYAGYICVSRLEIGGSSRVVARTLRLCADETQTVRVPASKDAISMEDFELNQSLPLYLADMANNSTVEIKEKNVTIYIGQKKLDVFYLEAVGGDRVPLVLLHGAAFSSKTWAKIGTIQLAARMGHWVIAVDLPRFTEVWVTLDADGLRGRFLEVFLEAVRVAHPVLVSPSMSGSYALPFIMDEGSAHTPAGYIPVAPIHTNVYNEEQYRKIKIPVLIVFGSKDTGLGVSSAMHLDYFPNSVRYVMQGAGHPAYIDKPQEWAMILYNFLRLFNRKDTSNSGS